MTSQNWIGVVGYLIMIDASRLGNPSWVFFFFFGWFFFFFLVGFFFNEIAIFWVRPVTVQLPLPATMSGKIRNLNQYDVTPKFLNTNGRAHLFHDRGLAG
jgi:hypothetical protein